MIFITRLRDFYQTDLLALSPYLPIKANSSRPQTAYPAPQRGYRTSSSIRKAFGNRILFSKCTCWCRSSSNSANSDHSTRQVLQASSGSA